MKLPGGKSGQQGGTFVPDLLARVKIYLRIVGLPLSLRAFEGFTCFFTLRWRYSK